MATTHRGSGAKTAPSKKPPTAFQIWFEEAWAGWLKHVSLILFAALLFILYQLDLFNERMLGLIVALGISLGALALGVGPARDYLQTSRQRSLLYGLAAVWALCAAYPIVHGIFPGGAYAAGKLADEGSQITLNVPDGGKQLYLTGKIKGSGGEVNATYKIVGSWQGGGNAIEGSLSRSLVRVRVGRRGGGTQLNEFNEQKHYLGRTHGPVTLKLDQKDEQLDKELSIELRPAPLPPLFVLGGSILVFLAGLALDCTLDSKGRTNLAAYAGISLFFAYYYGFDQARTHNVVRPAIGAAFLAVLAGGLGGWILTWLVRHMRPGRKRRPARA